MQMFSEQLSIEVAKAHKLIANGDCVEVNSRFDINLLDPLYSLVSQVVGEQRDLLSLAISAIADLSAARFKYHESRRANMSYVTDYSLMTEYEKGELHRLKLLLPSSGQIIADAKQRVREHLLARKAKFATKVFQGSLGAGFQAQ